MQLPNRKPNRLPDYDYSANGAYFITICTQVNTPQPVVRFDRWSWCIVTV